MKIKPLFLGFVAGSSAAVIATLLSAPASGKETRKKLSENKETFLSELRDLKEGLISIKESVAAASKESKTGIREFIHDIKLSVTEWKQNTDEHRVEISNELKEIEQTIEELEKNLAKTPQK